MASVKIQVLIKTDAKNLWSYLADFEKQKLWMIGLEKVVFIPQTNPQEPNPFIMTIKEGKKFNDYNGYVKEMVEYYKLIVVTYNNFFMAESLYTITPVGNMIRLDYEVFMTPKTWGYKIAFLTIGALFSRIMIRIFMKKLKNLAETK